ncbi:GNAT family N-acetyltransferase [Sediminibacterium soli]|uniref:GNAT family N-acetyltransferase n=1 Tax=Sediminibacterium soli TaxID=2698829 RepID=UPI00137B6E00|nr:GNAT family N-acetyltransferase [Sediminibacterium soli]NCI46806.1 N-acetyltransferase [Sediminibacterium soli]
MTEIQHETTEKGGSFYYEKDGKRLAEMVYVLAGAHKMIIEHTEVGESLKGQGVGKKLLETLVMYVREKGIKVVPLCPFAKATFDKVKEWQDVLF